MYDITMTSLLHHYDITMTFYYITNECAVHSKNGYANSKPQYSLILLLINFKDKMAYLHKAVGFVRLTSMLPADHWCMLGECNPQ